MENSELLEKFVDFLNEFYRDALVKAANENKKSIEIDFSLLEKFDVNLADYILENPNETIQLAEKAVKQIDVGYIHENFRLRFFNLPENREIRIRNVRAEHIGKMIVVDGIVKRASEVRPEVNEAIFQCLECGSNITIIQTERIIRAPVECENPACRNRKAFKLVNQKLYDARWVVVEEPFEIVSGERPSDLMIYLKEDLTSPKMQNKTDPGNRIKIVGILKELPRRLKGTRSRQMEIYLEANHVEAVETEWEELEITPEDEQKIIELAKDPQIYDKLVASISPAIYGHEEIKLAIALQLFGGETHVQKDKSRVRGDIHCLLVGDPSCLTGDERVVLGNGAIVMIGSIGSTHLEKINVPVYLAEGYKRGVATVFHKYEYQTVIEIVTESGKSIKGTPNHPLLTKKGWRRLDKLKIGDEVRCISWIPCSIYKYVELDWSYPKTYSQSKKIEIPKVLDERLASILGYMLADGYVQRYRVGCVFNYDELDLIPKIQTLFKEVFQVEPRFDYHKEKGGVNTEMVFNYKALANILKFIKIKRIPDTLMRSKNSVVAAFLSWLYDGDGSVIAGGRGKNGILYKAKDIELLRDIQILLLRFGIHSRIYGNNLMIRQGNSILKFIEFIGFNSSKKKNKLAKLKKNIEKLARKRHKKYWERIVKIIYHPPETVYDIEVSKYHKFVANGIVSHNTAKSAIMKVASTLIPRGRYVSGKGVSVNYNDPVIFMENGVIKTGLTGETIDKFYKTKKEGLISVRDLKVPALDLNTLEISWKPVRYVYRHKINEPLLKITLRTGRELRVTQGHSVFTIENCRLVEKKANELKVGNWLIIPRKITYQHTLNKLDLSKEFKKIPSSELGTIYFENGYAKTKFSKHKIPSTLKLSRELMKLLGYYIADGYLHEESGNSWRIHFILDARDKESIYDIKKIVKKVFNLEATENRNRNSIDLSINSKIVFLIFKYIVNVGTSTQNKKIPDIVFNVSKEAQLEFVKGLVKGDFGVTVSKMLISDLLYLFLVNGIVASFSRRKVKGDIKFPNHVSHVNTEVYELKSPKPLKILQNTFTNSNLHARIPIDYFSIPWITSLKKYGYERVSNSALSIVLSPFKKLVYERVNLLLKVLAPNELAILLKRNVKSVKQYFDSLYKKGFAVKRREDGKVLYTASEKGRKLVREIEFLLKLLNSDLAFLKIKNIETVNPSNNFVYDFSVADDENFIAGFGGVICHNTQAGLTASVIRDEEFLGGWVLEAGALVLSNRSLVSIDEFEKIEKTDQIALHEAMELQTISIAKANIVATLPAQTTILGGGNPKLGRFDPYLPIKEQIDVPETLLTRFDLKFALRDIPNPELDTKIADHILKARHYTDGEEEVKPAIDPDFLRKYVAYARKNCHPKLTKEAGETIKEFYLSLRERSGEESPISITPRQYEALIRLAEASAKIQLRNEVTKEDALRSIELMKTSLRQFGFEPETGRIDIDRAEGAKATAVQRSRIRVILDVLNELEKTFGKEIPFDEVLRRAREERVDEADEILKKMQQEGMIYSPKAGIISKV